MRGEGRRDGKERRQKHETLSHLDPQPLVH